MPVTYTAAPAQPGVQPKGAHTGVQTEVFSYQGTAAISAGDVVLLCKIPNFATVLDCAIKLATKNDTTASVLTVFIAKVNDGAASAISTFGTSGTTTTAGSVMFRPANAFSGPFRISLSDDAGVQYALLKMSVTTLATSTTSFSANGYVTYAMDEF